MVKEMMRKGTPFLENGMLPEHFPDVFCGLNTKLIARYQSLSITDSMFTTQILFLAGKLGDARAKGKLEL